MSPLLMILLTALAADATPSRPEPAIRHVVVVSVDGLRPEMLLPEMSSVHPGLTRLARGPHTLQARCDPDISITLPNHVDMITSRQVAGDHGHHWTENVDPPARCRAARCMHATAAT